MSECSHLDNCGNLVGYTEFLAKCPECGTELVVPEDKYLGHFVCPNSECSCLKEKPAIEIEPTEKDETAIKRARNILKPLFEEKQKGETTP